MAYTGSAAGAGEAVTVHARAVAPLQTVAPQANDAAQPKTEALGTRTMEGIQAT